MRERLCALNDLEEDSSAGFTATIEGKPQHIMVIRYDGGVYAYINECPHLMVPLDFTPGQFLNVERNLIQCSTHGALFQIEDGQCIFGPCLGKPLKPVQCHVSNDSVWID